MKTGKERLASVMFTYAGTDDNFTKFLKMMIRDYLEAIAPTVSKEVNCP